MSLRRNVIGIKKLTFRIMRLRRIIAMFLIFQSSLFYGQGQTVGVFKNDSNAVNGYSLFSPLSDFTTYLIDNCGSVVNTWEFQNFPGMMTYLLDDGSVLKAMRIFDGFGVGGSGGLLQRQSWEGDLLWDYEYSTDSLKQHHDMEVLENGNILIIAWERRTDEDIIAAGRDPEKIGKNGLWMEQVVELKPIGTDSAEIVWEWHLYDHLIQDFDPTQNNFGDVKSNPQRLDINYRSFTDQQLNLSGSADWLHFNSIDYNPELDVIIISSRNSNEIYAIDHSTSSLEAAGSTGGRYGKGGDFLFRWGNNKVFDSLQTNQILYAQHDARWTDINGDYTGEITIFNNGLGREDDDASSIEIIRPVFENGEFVYDASENSYAIIHEQTIFPEDEYPFTSPRMSGVQTLENGNLLICAGNFGSVYEIDRSGNLYWKFVNPLVVGTAVEQGTPAFENDIFRVLRYPVDHPAFEDKDLSPQGLLVEPHPDFDCQIIQDETTSTEETFDDNQINIYPNPSYDILVIDSDFSFEKDQLEIINQHGQRSSVRFKSDKTLDVSGLAAGMYIIRIISDGELYSSIFIKT